MYVSFVKSKSQIILVYVTFILMSCSGGAGPTDKSSHFSEGNVDTSFGSNGIVINSAKAYNSALSVLVQSDGKILVLNNSSDGSTASFTLMRYTKGGILDPTFNGTGTVYGTFSSSSALALQSDRKILVAGDYYDGTNNKLYVIRYNEDGTIDAGFGSGGIVQTSSLNNESTCKIALQSDGKILASGNETINGKSVPFLMRLNTDGSFDTSFGAETSIKTYIHSNGVFSSLAVGSDNKILIGILNYSQDSIGLGFDILKFTPNGLPDTTFGAGGMTTDSLPVVNQYMADLKVQSDGKIIVVLSIDNLYHGGVITTSQTVAKLKKSAFLATVSQGLSPWLATNVSCGIALVRYGETGTRDSGFGNGGAAMYTAGSEGITANSFVIQTDGKYTIAGQDWNGSGGFAIMRLNVDGTIDGSFGTGGMVTTPLGVNGGIANGVTIQQDGNIVGVGTSYNLDSNSLMLVRYN